MNCKYITPEFKEYLIKHYDGTSETITKIQERFNVPRYIVTSNARNLGLCSKNISYWTDEDLNYLMENWGNKTETKIAEALNRTQTAVHLKAKRLQLGGRKINYSCLEVERLLGICSKSVKRWGEKGYLKITRAKTDAKIWSVALSDLEEFLEKHQDLWDSRRMKYSLWIVEPDWMIQKRLNDKGKPKKKFDKWKSDEDKKLLILYRTGKDYKQIGIELDRSKDAVERRLARLNWGRGANK